MAYEDYLMMANYMDSVHGPAQCPYELRTGKKPDLLKIPVIPFDSVVMAHIPLDQQTTDGPCSILHYAVGTALGHLSGLILFNSRQSESSSGAHASCSELRPSLSHGLRTR